MTLISLLTKLIKPSSLDIIWRKEYCRRWSLQDLLTSLCIIFRVLFVRKELFLNLRSFVNKFKNVKKTNDKQDFGNRDFAMTTPCNISGNQKKAECRFNAIFLK